MNDSGWVISTASSSQVTSETPSTAAMRALYSSASATPSTATITRALGMAPSNSASIVSSATEEAVSGGR